MSAEAPVTAARRPRPAAVLAAARRLCLAGVLLGGVACGKSPPGDDHLVDGGSDPAQPAERTDGSAKGRSGEAPACTLAGELRAWAGDALKDGDYATYVTLRLAGTATQTLRQSPDSAAAIDSTALANACAQARARHLDEFLAEYGKVASPLPGTRQVSAISAAVDSAMAQAEDSATASATRRAAESRIEAARTPLPVFVGLYVLLLALGGLLVYVISRTRQLDHAINIAYDQQAKDLREQGRSATMATQSASSGLHGAIAKLDEELKVAVRNGKEEIRQLVSYVRSDVATILGRMPDRGGSDREYGGSTYEPAGGTSLYDERDSVVLDPPGGMEEATVDVRASDGSSEVILSERGLFRLRWSVGASSRAELSVDPNAVLGAGFIDKIDAAFELRGARRGTDRYRTVSPAICTWDSAAGQGRIQRRGIVDEAG